MADGGSGSKMKTVAFASKCWEEDWHKLMLTFFELTPESFNGGYHYSVAELMAIYLAKDFDYLCWVQGDCMPTTQGWVSEGIHILEQNPLVSVVSPFSEVNTWHDGASQDQFFSDQAFLIRTAEFRQPIYSGGEDILEYPPHGGDSFEKKVAQYLRKAETYRQILPHHWYTHPSY
jgi:hypothetical protein